MRNDSKTNIQVSRTTRDALANLGKKGDSYDGILRKLMKRTYDWDRVHVVSVPFYTGKSIQYMDVIIPKVDAMNIDPDEFTDAVGSVCEENNIRIIPDDEVPYFKNDHF